MGVCLKTASLFFAATLLTSVAVSARGQISLPGFGQKNSGSNDQKATALLHQHLPLDLDANSAYPTVANEDLLGGPFRGRALPITLDTLTKPLQPGDYILPMTFFCSEYSIHRPGTGTAYVLAPARGTAAKAISTLLWRGMLAGHKPQELQSVSWAIQGSVAYDKMPANYKHLVDELIPDMKNQVNGQAFADIEDGFQGKVNKVAKKISGKMTEGLGKVTGGRGSVDIKVDVELNESFQHLGRLGKMALDGENINNIVTAANLTDGQREQALYAGQGTQAAPLQAANGPWSVMVPGVAYMRFVVHGGNLQGDNIMQIRIVKQGANTAALDSKPHFLLTEYSQGAPALPTLPNLFNGSVNQSALSQCQTASAQPRECALSTVNIGGLTAFSVGTGDQAPIMTPAQPLPPISGITATPREAIARADISRNRTTIGVGEIVDLTLSGGSTVTWSINPANAGCLTVTGASSRSTQCQSSVTAANATFTQFNPDPTVETGEVEITAAQARSAQSLTLTIIKPSKAIWLPILPPDMPSPTLHVHGKCGAGAEGIYYFAPDNVSFSRIRFHEQSTKGVGSGVFRLSLQSRLGLATFPPHCDSTAAHPGWCGNIPVGSRVREGVGTRANSIDNMFFAIRDDQCPVNSGAGNTIKYKIGLQYSVRRPDQATLSYPVDQSELNNENHWGLYADLTPVSQELSLTNGTISVWKGELTPVIPSITKDSPTNYLVCNPSTPPPVVEPPISVISGHPFTSCFDLCTWQGESRPPQCDAKLVP